MALPTKQELAILETFRGKVADILTDEQVADDMFLLRWLRARDLNLEKAEEMLRIAMKWRRDNHLDDEIQKRKVDQFYIKNFPTYVDAMDKEGRPVNCIPFGKWDVRKVVKAGKSHEFTEFITQCFENLSNAIKISSKMHPPKPDMPPVTQMIIIYDWEGFSWGQLFSYQSVQNFLQMGSIYEAFYPEILHSCYFINAPSIISTVLTLLKPVVAPKTMEKIRCYGTDKRIWKEEVLSLIDAEQLRPEFGGTKTDDSNPFLEWEHQNLTQNNRD